MPGVAILILEKVGFWGKIINKDKLECYIFIKG